MPTNPNAQSVIDLSLKFAKELERKDLAALNRLIAAYGDIYRALEAQIDVLTLEIAAGDYTRTSVLRLERYQDLLAQVNDKLTDFQGFLATEIGRGGGEAVKLGELQARELLSTAIAGNPGIAGEFQKLPAAAIQNMLGFLDPAGPLYRRIKAISPFYTDKISQIILDGVTQGWGSKKLATKITNDGLGMALTDALRMSRTVSNWAYREANRASYTANDDVVKGWQWFTQLDDRACMSCVSMHGSIHPNTETLDDHHSGRCAMLPVVDVFGPIIPENAGRTWFDAQDEGTQRKMMGTGKLQAWQNKLFEFSDLSTERMDDIYGKMRIEKSLKDLIGVD